MRKSDGFSLIEVLIALGISSVALVAFFAMVAQFQTISWDLGLLNERNSNLGIAPLLLTKWISGAGNNRWNQSWNGVTTDGAKIDAKSDSEGPVGFPDNALTESYETISVRQKGKDLQISSKSGSFQPALKNITQLETELDPPSVTLRLTGATDRRLTTSKAPIETGIRVDLYLWNYRQNLFAEAP